MANMGIKETLEAALFGAVCGKIAVDVAKKRLNSWGIATAILPAISYMEAAVEKIEMVPAELADMTDEELTQLRQHVKYQLGLTDDDSVRRAVDASLLIARGIAEFVALAK